MHPVSLALIAGLDAVVQCRNQMIRRNQALAAGVAEATIESLVSRGH
jgi:tetrahydromethanopterin S-methyltransferase subunit F